MQIISVANIKCYNTKMYFPIGWPKVLKNLETDNQIIKQIVSNRDKILFAALSDNCLMVWYCKV